jgi:phage terminase large subunit
MEIIKENKNNDPIYADSAEPRTINELRQYGLRIVPVKKGPDSVYYGIKFLQDLEEIIIDDTRCPETAKEFLSYELEKDAQGNFKADFPDKNNHSIDRVRYALNFECMKYREEQQKKQPHYNFPSERPKPSAMGTVTEDFFKGGYD